MKQIDKNLKVLFCHYGIKDKAGFGRSFMLAKGLAELNNEVVFLTNQNGKSRFPYDIEIRKRVKIVSFPDYLPQKVLGLGFGCISILLKILFVTNIKFDVVHSDLHRPSAVFPCRWNRLLHHSKYISEWWDYYGKGGQYDNKHWLFKLFLGRYENKSEIKNYVNADGVVVLSEETKNRAIRNNINAEKIRIIHGGSDIYNIKYCNPTKLKKDSEPKIIFGYIGMSDAELDDLEPFIKAFVKCSKKLNIAFQTFGAKISLENKKKYRLVNIIESGWIDYFKNADDLSNIDVFILIKKDNVINRAGWPNKLGDYLAVGRPILLNLYGDLHQFSKKYPKGIITARWDQTDIERKIIEICNGEFELELMGKYNREIAEKDLSWGHKAAKLEDFYKSILNNNKTLQNYKPLPLIDFKKYI